MDLGADQNAGSDWKIGTAQLLQMTASVAGGKVQVFYHLPPT